MKSWREILLAAALLAGLCIVSGLLLSAVSLDGRVVQPRAASLLNGLLQAQAEDAPYRNAVYLYLRVAGVLWIAVEWMAALILWRGYRLLAESVNRTKEALHG